MSEAKRPVPQRVVVTSPRTRAARAPRPSPVRLDIDEQTELGAVYVRSLIRAELRLGLLVSILVGGVLAAVPPLLWLVPALRTVTVLGISLPWLVLGGAVYPFVVLVAWWYVRRAERGEREFTELVERS